MSVEKILCNKDIDIIIGWNIGFNYKIKENRNALNLLLITFKNYSNILRGVWKNYMFRIAKSLKINTLSSIFKRNNLKLNNNHFWLNTIEKFMKGDSEIIFVEQHNGNVRKSLYILGAAFGYSHINIKERRYEKTHIRVRHHSLYTAIYAENKIEINKLYTMKELRKLKCDWELDYSNIPSWIPTGKFKNEQELWRFNPDASFHKRGLMCSTFACIKFYNTNIVDEANRKRTYDNLMEIILFKKT